MIDYKLSIAKAIASNYDSLDAEQLAAMMEVPPNPNMGDLSLPCFKLSKTLRKSPAEIAEQLKGSLEISKPGSVEKAEAVSGYLNIYYDKQAFARDVITEVLDQGNRYGSSDIGAGKTVVIDYSSPNIAKPFHVGHLRSTVIGQAINNIHRFLGYETIGINHLGDWGTQFGKQIVAYERWGNREEVERGGVRELVRLYVKFHEEAERYPELDDEARAAFVKLESGDSEYTELWRWFIEVSLGSFNDIYELLGVNFDYNMGESFYNDKVPAVVQELKDKHLLTEDEGALIVRLDEFNMPPALIIKKDGATLYHTRDIAASLYRKRTYNFDKCVYVVDYSQNLHFAQWFKVVEMMGYDWAADQLVHVAFGRVSMESGGFSTRKGKAIWLEDVLNQSIEKTLAIINEKNPNLDNKEQVARQVGVGAIVFHDLSANRIKDIVFSWEDILNFDGETGPYVQYTHARACSLLRKNAEQYGAEKEPGTVGSFNASIVTDDASRDVLKQLHAFPDKVRQAMDKLEPSIVSRYLVDLAQSFNRFYHDNPIIVDDVRVRSARLALVRATITVLASGLALIGLAAPEKI